MLTLKKVKKIKNFYSWMSQCQKASNFNIRLFESFEVFNRIIPWEESEIKALSTFLPQKEFDHDKSWLPYFLILQPFKIAAKSFYGFCLLQGISGPIYELVKSSYFQPAWLMEAEEEDFLKAGGIRLFSLLKEGDFDKWFNLIQKYHSEYLKYFPWFVLYLNEDQWITVASNFPALVEEMIFYRTLLWYVTGVKPSPQWYRKVMPSDYRKLCIKETWVAPFFFSMDEFDIDKNLSLLDDLPFDVLVEIAAICDSEKIAQKIINKIKGSNTPHLISLWRIYSHTAHYQKLKDALSGPEQDLWKFFDQNPNFEDNQTYILPFRAK